MTNMDDRVTIRLDEQTYAQIKMLADQKGLSMAKIIREMLKRYLDRYY